MRPDTQAHRTGALRQAPTFCAMQLQPRERCFKAFITLRSINNGPAMLNDTSAGLVFHVRKIIFDMLKAIE